MRHGKKHDKKYANSFLALTACALAAAHASGAGPAIALNPAAMPVIGAVDARYQSYNIEMVEIMGGKWWAPYKTASTAAKAGVKPPSGIDTSAFMYRAPLDLANPRLRKLAAALSPAYVRVSDTWANTMYFQDSDAVVAGPAPAGFKAVLTGPQWKGVVDFSNAIDAQIVTSFSIGAGVRDANGVWTPVEAEKIFAYTKKAGGRIAAAEFFNEPNLAAIGGAPKGYDAAAYGRDFKVFRAFVNSADPRMKILGPGPVGEGRTPAALSSGLGTDKLLEASGPGLDAVSWHFYGAVSQRCVAMGPSLQTTADAALTSDWLSATDKAGAYYGSLRDRYEPGKALWLSETAESACGGNPWAADFIDSFRYLNQLGILAKRSVQVVMHNTLSASDYGLIDESTLIPRPNYWAAVLWRKLMGTRVLEAGAPATPNLYVYAHCLKDQPGGVAVLAINADRTTARELALPVAASVYALTADQLLGTEVRLNGKTLQLDAGGDLPAIDGVARAAGALSLAPASISFVALPAANNAACR
jgi:heparanase 1